MPCNTNIVNSELETIFFFKFEKINHFQKNYKNDRKCDQNWKSAAYKAKVRDYSLVTTRVVTAGYGLILPLRSLTTNV